MCLPGYAPFARSREPAQTLGAFRAASGGS